MTQLTVMQRLLRRPINWLVETFYPNGCFFGSKLEADLAAFKTPNTNSTSPAVGVVGYLVSVAAQNEITRIRLRLDGLTVHGVEVGDWEVTVTQTAAPGGDT